MATSAISNDETLAGDSGSVAPRRPLGRGEQVGRHLLVDPLGRGAMGQVFRAYDPDLERQIAIKVLFEDARTSHQDFLQEAKAMARIDHPNVIRIYDAGVHQGSVFIAMELVEGQTLAKWLETSRDRPAVVAVLLEAARGLAAAHAAGVVHRDFKPANVLVTADDHAKVGDFGLAGIDGATTMETGESEAYRGAIGTPAYMSPEHLMGDGIDASSDQFSFGIVLYEALYGRRPIEAESLAQLATRLLDDEAKEALAERRTPLDRVLARALDLRPERRFESMDALVAEVERITRPSRRGWWLAGGLALALGGIALATRVPPPPCEDGRQRLEAFWSSSSRSALQIGGADYTELYIQDARARFERAVDDYAEQWATAYDESCLAVGPEALGGSPAQQATAQCLDNRRSSLRGLVEFVSQEPLDASRVGTLTRSLPAIEDCPSGLWVPYPASPDEAARVAELHAELDAIRLARLAQRPRGFAPRAQAIADEARAMGQPYLLAQALREHSRLLGMTGQAEQAAGPLDEALEIAVASGHDRLAATLINDALLNLEHHRRLSWSEAQQLASLARGFVARSGGDERLLGQIELNLGSILRALSRPEDALVHDERALQHFEAPELSYSRAKARFNIMVSRGHQGQYAQIERDLPEITAEFERFDGPFSPTVMTASRNHVWILSITGRPEEAFDRSRTLLERARAHFAPSSETYRAMSVAHIAVAFNAGKIDAAEATLATIEETPPSTDSERLRRMIFRATIAELRRDYERALLLMRSAEQIARRIDDAHQLHLCLIEQARVHLLLGHPEHARNVLDDPVLTGEIEQGRVLGTFHAQTVMLAVLSELPPPPDRAWTESVTPETLPTPGSKLVLEAARIFEAGTEDRAAIERLRRELLDLTSPVEPDVQTLDAWLALHPP